jgi:hypothetical protein
MLFFNIHSQEIIRLLYDRFLVPGSWFRFKVPGNSEEFPSLGAREWVKQGRKASGSRFHVSGGYESF